MAQEFNVIGKVDCLDKQHPAIVTGRLDFAADHPLANKLYAATALSKEAHARILSIDTSQAMALPGVEAVCTYEDCPVMYQTILYWGQEIAAVAATDPFIAEQAAQLIEVEYETRPAVINMDEAFDPNSPLVGVWPDGNVQNVSEITRGDAEQGFNEADVVVEADIGPTAYYQHMRIEPESALAWWLEDEVYMHLHNRDPFGKRTETSLLLGVPEHKLHLFGHGCGGSHGSVANPNPQVIAAVLSKKAGKPVEMHYSRHADITQGAHQHEVACHAKLGAKQDGTFVACDLNAYGNGGHNPASFIRNMSASFDNTFACPNVKYVDRKCVTNRPETATWRNVTEPPSATFSTTIIDVLADELGMNPLDLRLKNLIQGTPKNQNTGVVFSSYGIKEVLEGLDQAIDFRTKWHAPGTKTLPDGRMHGIALTGHMSTFCSMWDPVGAIVNMTKDGKALISAGISRTGGGTVTAMCCIVAEMLGLKFDDVNVGDWGNTDVCSYGGMQAGSSRTITLGAGFYNAAKNAKEDLFAHAAKLLETTPDNLDAKDGVIFLKNNTSKTITHAEVCASFSGARGATIIGKGYGWTPQLIEPIGEFPVGSPCINLNACGTAVEVAVDTSTGEVEILKLVNCDDPGVAIFRRGAEHQILGCCMIQEGEALYYEQIFDDTTGATLNIGFLDHRHPTTLDSAVDKHEALIVETGDACGPYGCHGMGEPPCQSYAVISSAIFNAIGEWVTEYPIYPWRILKALGKA